MKTTNIFKDDNCHVVRVDYMGKFFYTKTYFYDADGYVEKTVTVFASGTVSIDPPEPENNDLEPITHFFQD